MGAQIPPPARGVPYHDDALHDFVAMVECARRDDHVGMAVVFRHADHPAVIAVAIKLLSELLDERHIPAGVLLAWGGHAIHRST